MNKILNLDDATFPTFKLSTQHGILKNRIPRAESNGVGLLLTDKWTVILKDAPTEEISINKLESCHSFSKQREVSSNCTK